MLNVTAEMLVFKGRLEKPVICKTTIGIKNLSNDAKIYSFEEILSDFSNVYTLVFTKKKKHVREVIYSGVL